MTLTNCARLGNELDLSEIEISKLSQTRRKGLWDDSSFGSEGSPGFGYEKNNCPSLEKGSIWVKEKNLHKKEANLSGRILPELTVW